MFDQFSEYPEMKWMATAAAQFIGPGDKIQINPDLESFKLERFVDLRKRPEGREENSFKLMLVGSSKTNIFIGGPDPLIDILYSKLPVYIGKSWEEISKIKLERSLINCKNFMKSNYCHPCIIDKFEFKEYKPAEGISYFNNKDLLEADKVCSNCKHFELEQFEERG